MTTTITIANPILHGMHPDPSWIWDDDLRQIVLVTSTFELVPGLPIYVSRDMAHWKHVSDAIDEELARRLLIPFVDDSGGVYAPTLRRIRGKYVIACTIARINGRKAIAEGCSQAELDAAQAAEGNFVLESDSIDGPWRGPFWIEGAEGIDPDIFEDGDGNVYWTQTRPAVNPQWEGQTEVWTQRINPETWTFVDDGLPAGSGKTVIWRGYGMESVWAEAPHLYRVGDYVYLMTAEGGTSFEHSEMAMRIYAPHGLLRAFEAYEREVSELGECIPQVRDGERCYLGTAIRAFHADKKNPILTHRHLGLSEPLQCVGHADLLLHPELGIGADAIIPEKRVIASSLNKQVIRRQLLKESLGEELRVLYVAMTRAKEKLILTGTVGKLEKQMLSLSRFLDEEEELLPLGTRMKAKNYWAFVLPALVRHRAMSELLWEYGILMKKQPGIYDDISEFVIKKITVRQMTEKAVLIQAGNQMQEEYLKNWDENKVYDEAVKEEIEKRFSFAYPYKYLEDIPVKVSVSDLKKRSWHDESELEENISVSAEEQEEEQEAPVPAFMAEKQEEYKGAARGTAYHRVMECLDYAEADTEEQLRAQLKRLLESQKMTEQEAECIRIRDIRRFVESGLGQRMKKAAMKKHLYREQPFVIQRSASMLDDGWKNETVLVQGIIDAYFMEEEEIVLVDYKTDRVKRGQEQKLIDLYHVQLEDYARALERMTGKRVKEKIIYSFTLQKEILL